MQRSKPDALVCCSHCCTHAVRRWTCRLYNDHERGTLPEGHETPPLTSEAMRATLRTALLEDASSIMERCKNNDAQRPGQLLTNLLLALWIGALLARASPLQLLLCSCVVQPRISACASCLTQSTLSSASQLWQAASGREQLPAAAALAQASSDAAHCRWEAGEAG